MRHHPFIPSKPLRRLYAYWLAATLIVRLPWWVLVNLTPVQRPRRSWTLRKAVTRRVLLWMFDEVGRFNLDELVYTPSYKKLEKGYGGVWVDAAPPELITGKVEEWADKARVQPTRIPGYWVHKRGLNIVVEQRPESDSGSGPEGEKEKEKVVYYLHGGGYLMFSAHPKQSLSNIPRGILKHCPSVKRSFALEYRLSSIPPEPTENSFPAALLDAIAGYDYLVNKVGYKPKQIVVVGDSAGGNLALALVRYLVENKNLAPRLPDVPGALVLLSPWCDMSGSHHSPTSSQYTNQKTDYISPPPVPFTPDTPPGFIAPFGTDFASQTAYISPACKHLPDTDLDVRFAGFPRTFVAAGSGEVLLYQIRFLVERMKKSSLGEDGVVYFEARDAFHDYMSIPNMEPETGDTLRAISRFLGEGESGLRTKL